jgi:hypothetical protein
MQCKVGPDGRYEIGPLSESETYEVSVRAPGYHFEDIGSGNFASHPYSGVDVLVVTEKGEPVEGVLVSLSGHGSRSTGQTEGNGRAVFNDLVADQYYLQPLLKEYEFRPASQLVDASEGNRTTQDFVALRHAYSVFGSVSTLNGDSVSGVSIQAVDEHVSSRYRYGNSLIR